MITRTGFLVAMAAMLNACSSTAPSVKYYNTTAYSPPVFYSPPVQPPAAPPKNFYTPQYGYQARSYNPTTFSGAFLKPGELQPAVEFWRKVYLQWGRSKVVVHDDRYLDVIYEVIELPGYVEDSLADFQKETIQQRRNYWRAQLSMLESKWRYNSPLNASEQQLIAKLQGSGRPLHSLLNGAAERVHAQRGIRERFMRGLAISARYDRHFRKIFRDAGLPEDLACLPHVESSFQPAARSSAGAVGIWQFTRGAAKRFMPASKRTDLRLDPFSSTVGAARYLSHAYNLLGDWPTAITSYNHGIAGMKRAQDQVGRDFVRIVQNYASPSFGFASRNYYAQFLAAREIASQQAQNVTDRAHELARE